MAYKAISKAEAKRFVHEVRKAHDVIIERIYAHKDTVTAANNGLAPKLPDEETKFLNGKGEWVIPPNDVYTLQSASFGELGGVKIAENTGITIGSSGVISVVPASSSVIGGIKFPTTNVSNTYLRGDGTWVTPTDTKYTLPVATNESLGGVIVGDNISVSADGKIGVSIPGDNTTYLRGDGTWVTPTDTKYTLPVATNESLGGVIVGDNISVSADGKIGVSIPGDNTTYLRGDGTWVTPTDTKYTLPVATNESLGGVIVGKGLTMDGDTLNVSCEDKSLFKFNAPYAPPEIDIDFLSIPVENNVDIHAKTWSTDSTSDESPEFSFVAIVGRPAKFGDIIYWTHTSNRNGWAIRTDDKWINLGIDDESDTRWSAINPLLSVADREKLDSLPYILPVATNESLGGVIVGDNISVSADGKIGIDVTYEEFSEQDVLDVFIND